MAHRPDTRPRDSDFEKLIHIPTASNPIIRQIIFNYIYLNMEQAVTKSTLSLNNRNELHITGIKKVKSTEPNIIVANLDNGSVVVNGANLSVQRLDIKEGVLDITGQVNGIKFTNQVSKSFSIKNMFK